VDELIGWLKSDFGKAWATVTSLAATFYFVWKWLHGVLVTRAITDGDLAVTARIDKHEAEESHIRRRNDRQFNELRESHANILAKLDAVEVNVAAIANTQNLQGQSIENIGDTVAWLREEMMRRRNGG